jgi:hypothetical protein
MNKRHKDILRSLVLALRQQLLGAEMDGERGDLDREMERLGFAPDGSIGPLDALPGANAYQQHAYRTIFVQLHHLSPRQRIVLRRDIIERAAYTWTNRLLALRAMEARGLIDKTLRGDEDYGGISEKLYILRAEQPERVTGEDGGWWAVLTDACQMLAQALPGLFALNDPTVALRPSTPALLQCIALTTGTAPLPTAPSADELDAAFADPDAIGWAYQFYQQGPKEQIYATLKGSGKAGTREEIAAATQLFTEPYMVQWLLQNSLGRSYAAAYPHSRLPATWPYYVQTAQPEHQANASEGQSRTLALSDLTLLDPCVGSGHFLREAFDMLVAMYREQEPQRPMRDIVQTILSQHLYGIDLDPRAAQLTALTLYLRAWELLRNERKALRQPLTIAEIPSHMNVATTPRIPNGGALQRHLQRHPEDTPLQPFLTGMFASLEQADILGSLLRPREYLASVVAEFQRPETLALEMSSSEADWYHSLKALVRLDPDEGTRRLLQRISISFESEVNNDDDVSAALFGRAALEGVKLLRLLMRHYAIVVANPPYMGSKNMDAPLKRYVERYYAPGKRDLYAAFILRCLELCQPNGRVAMVTQQSWMFLRSFANLRAIPAAKLLGEQQKGHFTGILRATSIDVLAHLGPNAFEEISGEVVQSTMFVLANHKPGSEHQFVAFRLTGLDSNIEKASHLRNSKLTSKYQYMPFQANIMSIESSPISYWLFDILLDKFTNNEKFVSEFLIKGGLSTTDNARFVRFHWEISSLDRWSGYTKGGGYCRWVGNDYYMVDWGLSGARMKAHIMTIPGNTHWSRRIFNSEYYFKSGYSYSPIASGSLGVRKIDASFVLGHKGPAIFAINDDDIDTAGIYNSRLLTYMLRAVAPQLGFEVNHLLALPSYGSDAHVKHEIIRISLSCVAYKKMQLLTSIIDKSFTPLDTWSSTKSHSQELIISAILCVYESLLDRVVFNAYNLDGKSINLVLEETGTPAGWYPLITNYDALPVLPDAPGLPPLPRELFEYLAIHERVTPDEEQLAGIKRRLRALYEAGPGVKEDEQEESGEASEEDEDEESDGRASGASGAHIPIPTETFLEALSVKMQLHPISVYWLLEELRAEGARCRPEERRGLEDRLSVLVLRLLGHRWPGQIEAGEPVPTWAEPGGILTLVPIFGKATLAERVRERLIAEDGEKATQQTEALLQELTGYTLEAWLRRCFFARHMSQFKARPIAWHLSSTPLAGSEEDGVSKQKKQRRSGGVSRHPAFECLLYYHACAGDALARIRTLFLEPLLRAEQAKLNTLSSQQETGGQQEAADSTQEEQRKQMRALANARLHELRDFETRLRGIEERGFAFAELAQLLAREPLDRWSGDGYSTPESLREWQRMEGMWHVDINDGVRVNIAPLQLAGVLAKEVLARRGDAQKAIVDRARWRADERRWVREGKLPRCGWMHEAVPASAQWIENQLHVSGQQAQGKAQGQTIEQQLLQMSEGAEE